jgi:hypothetical protein
MSLEKRFSGLEFDKEGLPAKPAIDTTMNRRFFLIGSASVICAPLLNTPKHALIPTSLGGLSNRFKYRKIHDIDFTLTPGLTEADYRVNLSFSVCSEISSAKLMQFSMGSNCSYRWHAFPGEEIVVFDPLYLKIEVTPAVDNAVLHLTSNCEYVPAQKAKHFLEQVTFKNGFGSSNFEPLALDQEYSDYSHT